MFLSRMRQESGGICSEVDATRGGKTAVQLCWSGVTIYHSKEVIRVYCRSSDTVGELM